MTAMCSPPDNTTASSQQQLTTMDDNNNKDRPYPPLLKKKHRKPVVESAVSNEYALNFAFLSFFGFTILQFIFALTAQSQSMLADCAAMSVDCVTYLFNYGAERLKHHNEDDDEQDMNDAYLRSSPTRNHKAIMTDDDIDLVYERHYKRQLRLLYLEVLPPLLSVTTLVVVTILALRQAIGTIMDADEDENEAAQPDLTLMLLFSAINLVLDGVNVLCFARADHAKGLTGGLTVAYHVHMEDQSKSEHHDHHPDDNGPVVVTTTSTTTSPTANETTHLLSASLTTSSTADDDSDADDDNSQSSDLNLNMCSAWTHICADTLRSITVLIAAGFAKLFPKILTAADADSWGAVVVSIIIILSLCPLVEGLYFTVLDIHQLLQERQAFRRQRQAQQPTEEQEVLLTVTV